MIIQDCELKYYMLQEWGTGIDYSEGDKTDSESMLYMQSFRKEYENCVKGYPVGDRNIARGFAFACPGVIKKKKMSGPVGNAFLDCSRCIYYLN